MVEPNQLKEIKDIIACLKEQNDNKESSTDLGINLLKVKRPINTYSHYAAASNISQTSCDNFQHKTKEESAADDHDKLRNIISNLKARKEQKFNNSTSIDKTVNTIQNGVGKFTNSLTTKIDENVLKTRKEGVSKANISHLPKLNKRFKPNHINSGKQLHLTEFYNVVKSVGIQDNKYSYEFDKKSFISQSATNTGKSKSYVDKSQSFQKLASLNSNINNDFNEDKTVPHTYAEKEIGYVPPLQRNNPKSREKRMRDLFHNIQRKDSSQSFVVPNISGKTVVQKLKEVNRVDTQKKEHKIHNTYETTVDDFCNKIMILTNNKLENSKLTISEHLHISKENIFLKSFSTGNIISEKECHKDTNSVPLTCYEKRNVKKRLESNTTFDDFIERILKKINKDNNKNIKSKNGFTVIDCSDSEENNLKIGSEINAYNKMGEHSNEDVPILPQHSDNKEMQVLHSENLCSSRYENTFQMLQYKEKSQNSEPVTAVTDAVTVTNKNINLTTETNFSESDRDNDEHKNLKRHELKNTSQDVDMYWSQSRSEITQKYIDIEKDESTSPTSGLDLISERDNHIIEDKRVFVEKENDIEDFYFCVDTHCSQNETNVEKSLETRISLLDNDVEKSILTTAYRKKKISGKSEENVDSFKLESFLENIIPSIEKKDYKKNASHKCKFHVKRYRKGKTKIYKLKKLKKRLLETEKIDEELNFHDLLKKITADSCKNQPRLSRFKSGSSISTCSSYVPDDTKSEDLSTGSIELTSPQQRLRDGFNKLSKDKSLCYSGNEWEDAPEHDKEDIKMKIQSVFFQILEDFKNKRSSYFKHRRQSFDNCIFKDERLQFKPITESSMTVVSSETRRSKAKFQLMLYILKKIQTLLETDTKLTKRELYYQLKELISDQRVSDRAINAISCLLDVGMWALNIIAQKGLVFGDLKLLLSSGEMLNCNIPGTLIPQDINDIVEVHSTAYFILVVEKESIFHKLIEEDLPNKLTRPFIMITGKGFPDLNTQLFLRKLWMVMSIPVFILVDADPHGINIMLNYRFGSMSNAHVSGHLAVPRAKWLGVYPSEIINLNIARQPLSDREIKLVNHMLETPYMEFSPKLVDELRVLLTIKFKAGIEGLMKTDTYLSQVYLPNKFFTHNFI